MALEGNVEAKNDSNISCGGCEWRETGIILVPMAKCGNGDAGGQIWGGGNYFCLQYILFAGVGVFYNLSIKYLYIYVVTDYVK